MSSRPLVAIYAVTTVGFCLSIYLAVVHAVVARGGTAGLCNVNEYLSCDAAASSSYAEIAGVPIAVIGAAFYAASLVLTGAAMVRRRKGDERAEPLLIALMAGNALAFLYSLVLLTVSISELDHICPACAGTYVVNLTNVACTWYALGRSPRVAAQQLSRKAYAIAGDVPAIAAAALFVSLIATGAVGTRLAINAAGARPPATRSTPSLSASELRATHAPSLGPKEAPVVVVVFSDFQCPFCARFANIVTRLHEAFPEQLRLEFRNFPLEFHRHSALAARAAICAHAEGRFWPLHDQIFAQQEQLSAESLPLMISDAGLNPHTVLACADSREAKDVLAQDLAAGEKLELQGTPSFVFNGRLINGFLPYSELDRMVRDELQSMERAEAAP